MNRLALSTLAVLLLCACGKSYETVIAERRAEIEPKLARIDEAGRKSLTHHETVKDVTLPNGDTLRFGESPNAALMQADKFAEKTGEQGEILDLIIDTTWYGESRKALGGSSETVSGEYLESLFNKVAAIKYLVVVRQRLMVAPSTAGDGLFSPGLWQGEVMVFEVSSGDFLGGASLTASNSDEVNVNVEDPARFLRSDLWSNVRARISEALAPHSQDQPFGSQ